MSTEDSSLEAVRAQLDEVQQRVDHVRGDTTTNMLSLVLIIVVGTGIAWFHWVGFLLGGLAIGVISRSLIGAILNAIWFGVVALAVHLIVTVPTEVALQMPELTPIVYVTVGTAIGLPLLGSLVQGVFPDPD
ncbi:MAG: hypothetical protein U5K37_07350 [Natrialbaceae archaeon]|nr:hypothetical protein [Natrialbaceae archaeon]